VVFDVMYRLLRHLYGEQHVTYASNFTDIDDKIINRARERGVAPMELANGVIESFHASMDKLNVLRPNIEPRVSGFIGQIVAMVDALVEKGYAYVTPGGDVMYDTVKFPAFGELARRKLDEQRHGERVAVDNEKKNPNDFVLWKANAKSAAKLEQAFLPKDFCAKHFDAAGRPGWHIECSAMSRELLGDTFDIHGGGEDLQFPHHSCEIAQTEALTHQPMCDCWMHVAFITVGGKRMGKSEGNFTTIKDALAKYSPEAIRLWLLQTHYRKPVDFSDEALEAAENRISKMYRILLRLGVDLTEEKPDVIGFSEEFLKCLSTDLDTSNAQATLNIRLGMLATLEYESEEKMKIISEIKFMADMLGILREKPSTYLGIMEDVDYLKIEALTTMRNEARAKKDWKESDRLRDELLAQGIILEDKPDGTTTWRRK
jgi:cysteinyl-tRNA synthetase